MGEKILLPIRQCHESQAKSSSAREKKQYGESKEKTTSMHEISSW
jgi:hypothetical protein